MSDVRVRFLKLEVLDDIKRKTLVNAVERVLHHGRIVLGPEVEELEKKIAHYCGVRYAVGVNSGTDAVYLAIRSMDIGPGDEVITTCLSWIATANAIRLAGATPVFVDIQEDFNINPDEIESKITKRTKAILPVHFTGKICNMEKISAIAQKYNIPIIEDAAQAFGATRHGKKAGSYGSVAAFSMNPMKVFAACGEAGMVLTNDDAIYQKLLALRYNGTIDRTEAVYISHNGRLDTLQAAILLERFNWFDDEIAKRKSAVEYYRKNLKGIIGVPSEEAGCHDVYYTFNCIVSDRDNLQAFLTEQGIETKIHHSILMPHHKAYNIPGSWPVGERIAKNSLCLPLYTDISRGEQDYVIDKIKAFYRG
jgi:dTDP-4-amino-4,6-dideoxygalactose transaminase